MQQLIYSDILSWETTAMRNHLPWKTPYSGQKVLDYNEFEPVTKDHMF